MRVTTIETSGLGDRSYVVDDGDVAVVIDPQRDIDRVHGHLDAHGLVVAAVCETHVHNDYVSGGLALARTTGADLLINRADDVIFDHRPVDPGDDIRLGALRLQVVAAPGHTPTHLAYVVTGDTTAVFTGGSMLYGTVGRTDLLGAHLTDELSRAQHRTVRGLAEELSPEVTVHPTHGFGSFCASAGGGSRTSGTIADERRENIAVTEDDENAFVELLTGGFTAHPPYYAHMGLLNRAGPGVPDLSPPPSAGPTDLAGRIARGEWVVDLRDRRAFAAAHLAGTIGVEGSGSLATHLGWAIPWGTPVSLVADDEAQVADAQRELVRIGIDRPLAMATGGPDVYGRGQDVTGYPVRTFADLAAQPGALVVDVRRDDEWDAGHLDGAVHLRMEDLAEGAAGLPDGPLWVHCASGFRAAIAASIIARAGKDVVLIDDAFDHAGDSGRTITR